MGYGNYSILIKYSTVLQNALGMGALNYNIK